MLIKLIKHAWTDKYYMIPFLHLYTYMYNQIIETFYFSLTPLFLIFLDCVHQLTVQV